MPAMKPGPGDPDAHGLRIVAVDARDGVLDQRLPLVVLQVSRASRYGMADTCSKPFCTSPFPTKR